MKKNILVTGSIILASALFFLNGCKKDDTTAPVVTLSGSSSMTISLNSSFSDPGATATDDKDGSITPTVSGSVDKDTRGTYTLTYTATDAAGNVGTATRTVTVKNDADYLEGTYLSSEDGFVTTWTQTVTADAHHNNRIVFQFFADYVTNPLVPSIYGQVTGSQVELPTAQTAVGGASGCTHIIAPNGAPTIPIALVAGKYNFSVKFTDTQQSGGAGCTATGAVPYEDVLHQQ